MRVEWLCGCPPPPCRWLGPCPLTTLLFSRGVMFTGFGRFVMLVFVPKYTSCRQRAFKANFVLAPGIVGFFPRYSLRDVSCVFICVWRQKHFTTAERPWILQRERIGCLCGRAGLSSVGTNRWCYDPGGGVREPDPRLAATAQAGGSEDAPSKASSFLSLRRARDLRRPAGWVAWQRESYPALTFMRGGTLVKDVCCRRRSWRNAHCTTATAAKASSIQTTAA